MSERLRVVSEGDGWWTIQRRGALGRWADVETDMNAASSPFEHFDSIEKARAFVRSQCDQPAARATRSNATDTGGSEQ